MFIIGYYPVLFITSQFLYYLDESEIVYTHDRILVKNVDFSIWTNSASSTCYSSRFCPIIKRCYEEGPYTIGIRVVDKDHIATRLWVHSASIIDSKKQLYFNGSSNKNRWLSFKKNASEWIVNAAHGEEIELDDVFKLKIDFSIEKKGIIIRKESLITLSKAKKITKGFVLFTSWLIKDEALLTPKSSR